MGHWEFVTIQWWGIFPFSFWEFRTTQGSGAENLSRSRGGALLGVPGPPLDRDIFLFVLLHVATVQAHYRHIQPSSQHLCATKLTSNCLSRYNSAISKSQAAVRNELTRVLATDTMSSTGVLGARVDGAVLSLRSLKSMYFNLSRQIHPDKGCRFEPENAKMAMQVLSRSYELFAAYSRYHDDELDWWRLTY